MCLNFSSSSFVHSRQVLQREQTTSYTWYSSHLCPSSAQSFCSFVIYSHSKFNKRFVHDCYYWIITRFTPVRIKPLSRGLSARNSNSSSVASTSTTCFPTVGVFAFYTYSAYSANNSSMCSFFNLWHRSLDQFLQRRLLFKTCCWRYLSAMKSKIVLVINAHIKPLKELSYT